MFNDEVLVTTVTIIMSYLVILLFQGYFLADCLLPNIGINCSNAAYLTTLGLFLAAFGKTAAYPETEHFVHNVW